MPKKAAAKKNSFGTDLIELGSAGVPNGNFERTSRRASGTC
jgi:hypothetical protein